MSYLKGLFKGCLTVPNLLSLIRIILVPVFAVLYNLIRKLVHKGVQFRKKQEEERENSPKEEAGKIEKTASVEAIFEEKIEKVLQ